MIKSCLLLGASLAVAAVAACGGGPAPATPANPPASASASASIPPAPSTPPPDDAGAPPAASASAAVDAGPPAQSAFAAQAATGEPLYVKYCAECHDSDGSGISAPAVVGLAKGALPMNPPSDSTRKSKFNTWFDVGDFIAKTMPPPDKKVTLHPDEVWAITAWILQRNMGDLGPQTLDANVAKTVPIRK